MKLNWKSAALGALAAVLIACSGCSGINASQSISPATFFLPGLGQVTPDSPVQHCETNGAPAVPQLATLR